MVRLTRPLSPTQRLQLRIVELAWILAWAIAGWGFRSPGEFVCGLVCAWGLFELGKWEAAV